MTHSTDRDDYDYPVVDRAHDEDPELVDQDPDGTEADADAEAEYRASTPDDGTTILPVDGDEDRVIDVTDARDRTADEADVDLADDLDDDADDDVYDDDAPAHRADLPVDAVPGEADPAGPGDPFPGTGLSDDTGPHTGEATVVAVDDVAAQDSAIVVAPAATDDVTPVTDPDATPEDAAEVVPAAVPADDRAEVTGDATADEEADAEARWRDLQVMFVDEPAAAVREAADLLEQAVADLRRRLEGSDSTEDLRTAFRKYRDVHRSLR